MRTPQISVVLNVHREMDLLQATLRSVAAARNAADKQGVEVELICVLDRADDTTREIAMSWSEQPMTCVPVDFGDLGLSRNAGVARAGGRWIAFMDGDDLWCQRWLIDAYRQAMEEKRVAVFHPEVILHFGAECYISCQIDQDSPDFHLFGLAERNYWNSLCFTSRQLLLDVPLRAISHDRRIGYEDWAWNMEVLARGAVHKVVYGASLAKRQLASSLSAKSNASGARPLPSDLFRTFIARRLQDEEPHAEGLN